MIIASEAVGEYVRAMAWQWGTFRGKRVLVHVIGLGKLALEDGRVDIRFKLGDSRTYPANKGNVSLDPKGELIDDFPADAVSTHAVAPAPKDANPDSTFANAWIA